MHKIAPRARMTAGLLLGVLLSQPSHATDATPFDLGTVEVLGSHSENKIDAQVRIAQEQIRERDRQTVGAAVALAPGVYLGRVGARGEEVAFVRGFDLRQMPLFIDGLPVYVPYDGYVDLGRFLSSDIARIDISRGFGSLLYGANTLGGAINLISRRPSQPLELDSGGQLGLNRAGDEVNREAYANLGLHRDYGYAQLGVAYRQQDRFELPADFTATTAEDGGARNNSDSEDRRLSAKLAYTPGGDEYVLGYNWQQGEKGTPPYAGSLSSIKPRYWRWPSWDKDSVYAMSRTQLGEHELKLRVYHDTFKNSLFSYDDASYTRISKPYAFRSWYDDFSNGAGLETRSQLREDNQLHLAATWKQDVHREHNAGEPIRHFKDRNWTIGGEDTQQLGGDWSLVGGLAYEARQSLEAQDYNATTHALSPFAREDNDALSGELGLFRKTQDLQSWRATYAHRNRFPTIKDRYSYRLGTAIPNEALKPERADHFEAGYARPLPAGLDVDLALFYSNIRELIQAVRIADSACASAPCTQNQNVGKVHSGGVDLALHGHWTQWRLDLSYSYLDRSNRSNARLRLTDAPRNQFNGELRWLPLPQWSLASEVQAMSKRYSSTDATQVAAGFGVMGLSTHYAFTPHCSASAGVHNLFDRLYEFSEGYPEAGRSYYLRAEYRL